MLQFLPRRQISHVEVSTTVTEKMPPVRKASEGGYLERKTRHGSVISIDADEMPLRGADLRKDQLIQALKRDVKRIMDESAARKRISLQSPVVTALCVSVENCLLDGLRRRLLGLFGVRTTFALLHSIAKNCGPAANVVKLTSEHSVPEEYGQVVSYRQKCFHIILK
uniref:RUN domain-containing protein n=1 Tax=Panagrellus redivivus TaxID=6233 RepID=A0A7E4VSX7_PANRE